MLSSLTEKLIWINGARITDSSSFCMFYVKCHQFGFVQNTDATTERLPNNNGFHAKYKASWREEEKKFAYGLFIIISAH